MWINEKKEMYNGKSVSEMLDEPEMLSDPKLIALIVADGKSCPSENDCIRINDSIKGTQYMPESLSASQTKRLKALYELINRLGVKKGLQMRRPEDIYQYTRHYAYSEQEQLIVLGFNSNAELLCCDIATKGLADRTVVHPREVFKNVIRNSGTSVVMVHNHPSGNTNPSSADISMTNRIKEAGNLLGIKLIDHLVISTEGYYSFREQGDI